MSGNEEIEGRFDLSLFVVHGSPQLMESGGGFSCPDRQAAQPPPCARLAAALFITSSTFFAARPILLSCITMERLRVNLAYQLQMHRDGSSRLAVRGIWNGSRR